MGCDLGEHMAFISEECQTFFFFFLECLVVLAIFALGGPLGFE